MTDEQIATLKKLCEILTEASANGLLDILASDIHPDGINEFCDGVTRLAEELIPA